MQRDLGRLANQSHDLLVIGGGIYGAALAWEAALRGLSVALVEKGDFGQGTSSNSLKVVHGGLRYLQDLNPVRMRTMIRERNAIMRMAPHLVRPLPFVMPTWGYGIHSRAALRSALLVSDLAAYDRNAGLEPANQLGRSRVLTKDEFMGMVPELDLRHPVTGAAMWFDAQVHDTERFLLALLQSASNRGATIANYAEARYLTMAGSRVTGAVVRDHLSDSDLKVRAEFTINATGPWVDCILHSKGAGGSDLIFRPSLAVNLVTRKIVTNVAVGLPTAPATAADGPEAPAPPPTLFMVPWRDRSLIGTFHLHHSGGPDELAVSQSTAEAIIASVNRLCPEASLSIADVTFVHAGLLPAIRTASNSSVTLAREGWVVDHRSRDGVTGLITVVGVKYTACRSLAERIVDCVMAELGKSGPSSTSDRVPLDPGRMSDSVEFTKAARQQWDGRVDGVEIAGLISSYGTEYESVLAQSDQQTEMATPGWLWQAQTKYAVREEMAQSLADVVFRRMGIGTLGRPAPQRLEAVAGALGEELGWAKQRIQRELERVSEIYNRRAFAG